MSEPDARARLTYHLVLGVLHEASPDRLSITRDRDVRPALRLAARYFAEAAAEGDLDVAGLYQEASIVLWGLLHKREPVRTSA